MSIQYNDVLRSADMNTPLDNPYYYLDNFRFVLTWVAQRYGDLLDDEERDLIDTFPALPDHAQALLVRMVMRKGDRFRASKLRYTEIGDARAAAAPLIAREWVEADSELDVAALCGLLTRQELALHLPLAAPKGALKGTLLALALQRADPPRRFSAWCPDLDDALFTLRIGPVCDRIRLMFFGNLHQDWSEFVLANLGIYRYEQIAFTDDSRAFNRRADIDDYLAIQLCRDRFHDGPADESVPAELARLAEVEQAVFLQATTNPWLQMRCARLLFQIAQRCEQLNDYPAALRAYERCNYPGARLRRIRTLEKHGDIGAAWQLAVLASSAPESPAEQQGLRRMLPRLQRRVVSDKADLPPALPALREPDTIALQLPAPAADFFVEHIARDHFAARDPASRVFYVENALINSLFGLLCWDAIFMPLPGAFFHPFQSGPADLHRPDFAQRRAAQFNACLQKLDDGGWQQAIRDTYRSKFGLQSPFVYWEVVDQTLLDLALVCIPPHALRRWCERLLENIAEHRSGFPDLIVFWPDQQRYQMIEVKGPGDRLQDNQRRLIDFALGHGMPVAVCTIAWVN